MCVNNFQLQVPSFEQHLCHRKAYHHRFEGYLGEAGLTPQTTRLPRLAVLVRVVLTPVILTGLKGFPRYHHANIEIVPSIEAMNIPILEKRSARYVILVTDKGLRSQHIIVNYMNKYQVCYVLIICTVVICVTPTRSCLYTKCNICRRNTKTAKVYTK